MGRGRDASRGSEAGDISGHPGSEEARAAKDVPVCGRVMQDQETGETKVIPFLRGVPAKRREEQQRLEKERFDVGDNL